MNAYCTIITHNYFHYAKALYDSLNKFENNVTFFVLIVDDYNENLKYDGIEIIQLSDLKKEYSSDLSKLNNYRLKDKESSFRWALKPVLLKFLLSTKHYEKAIFLDPDLFFYNKHYFLFDFLTDSDIFITPHWRTINPELSSLDFDELFSGGLFNAGIFGCNKNAIDILDWWLKVCVYKMVKENGFYVDQGYLNLLPLYFKNRVHIVEHKGCNIAGWNRIECERTKIGDEVLINNEYPIVFIHFTNGTINHILNGKDDLLMAHLKGYIAALQKHKPTFEIISKPKNSFWNKIKSKINFNA